MAWFKRTDKGIQTPTEEKKDTPKGLWYKTPSGKIIDTDELKKNLYVSPEDGYHVRIGSKEYFEIFLKVTTSDETATSYERRNQESGELVSVVINGLVWLTIETFYC